jgi:hypothetical protein
MRHLLLLIIFISCNPVKQVLRDQEKLEEVAKVVVKGGWCANDTTYITKSDTLIEVDTIISIDTLTDTYIINDTVYLTKWNTREITKTLTIHDTLRSVITDNARVRLLQADSARLSNELITWQGKARRSQIYLFGLIGLFILIIYLRNKI